MSEDLVVTGDFSGTLERPKNFDSSDLSGTEGIRRDEIRLPRLAIAQGLSPQLVPDDGAFIPGLVIGQMFNDVTNEIYGNGPITVIPLIRHVSRIEFDPEKKGVPKDRNVPVGDKRLEWDGDNPPLATEYVEFVSIILRPGKTPEPIVVSIKTTNKDQRKAAELWTTYIAMRNGAIYSGLYKLTTKIIRGTNRKGQATMYGVFVVKNDGFIPTDNPQGAAILAFAKRQFEKFEGKTIEVNREPGVDDAPDPGIPMDDGAAAKNDDIPF